MKKALLALAALVVVAAVGIGIWIAVGDDEGDTVTGACGSARSYSLEGESEDGGYEVTFEVQSAAPGESWQVAIEQDGEPLVEGTRQTDEDAELDVDARADADGGEITATATPEDGEACTATLEP
ncbi:hypothetical protein [Nocardioides sp. SYSU D00038]|uniref:hypothetical protein n=1 Tax=Nocardioides sp. SYSU D00038 TaxID=2812554 RepID=UPI0019676E84|nr:hypothetical protein [Nocardioides sp. SYSU D00038]